MSYKSESRRPRYRVTASRQTTERKQRMKNSGEIINTQIQHKPMINMLNFIFHLNGSFKNHLLGRDKEMLLCENLVTFGSFCEFRDYSMCPAIGYRIMSVIFCIFVIASKDQNSECMIRLSLLIQPVCGSQPNTHLLLWKMYIVLFFFRLNNLLKALDTAVFMKWNQIWVINAFIRDYFKN